MYKSTSRFFTYPPSPLLCFIFPRHGLLSRFDRTFPCHINIFSRQPLIEIDWFNGFVQRLCWPSICHFLQTVDNTQHLQSIQIQPQRLQYVNPFSQRIQHQRPGEIQLIEYNEPNKIHAINIKSITNACHRSFCIKNPKQFDYYVFCGYWTLVVDIQLNVLVLH